MSSNIFVGTLRTLVQHELAFGFCDSIKKIKQHLKKVL